jgi:hypothetical protein
MFHVTQATSHRENTGAYGCAPGYPVSQFTLITTPIYIQFVITTIASEQFTIKGVVKFGAGEVILR